MWLREHDAELDRGVGIQLLGLTDDEWSAIAAFCRARPPLYYDLEATT